MIDGHGDDIYKYGQKITSNFSSNIFSKQDFPALREHLCSCLHLIYSYPEPDAHSLSSLLSKKYELNAKNICTTNGATEAIYLIAQAYKGSQSSIIVPTFSEYEDACRIHSHKLSFIKELQNIEPPTEMVWLCNPNNPTGFTYDIYYLKDIVKQYPDTLFVFDQSYGYFTNKKVWNIKEAAEYKNVILLHSMTKEYAVPGLRLGYITAHTDIVKQIEKFRIPWSVNALAIEAGKFLINNVTELLDIKNYLAETVRLQDKLKNIQGLKVFPTDTHFFLCKLENRKAFELKEYLIDNYGILIRDASNFRGLDESYFRIATQSPGENDLLVKALQEWI